MSTATLKRRPRRKLRKAVDAFAGGGGASTAFSLAMGRGPDIAINHDGDALKMHAANHPRTKHVHEDVWKAQMHELLDGSPMAFLWASPDCTDFSIAKGDKPVSRGRRSLAWVVARTHTWL